MTTAALAGLAAATVAAATLTATPANAALSSLASTPHPVAPHSLAAVQTMSAQNSDSLVASRPAFLKASGKDHFARGSVASSNGTNYVPYQRTYAGLPVVGGDFVVVTNNAGQVVTHSVAQQRAIGTLSTTPTVTRAKARSVASAKLKSVSKIEDTKQVVYALGTGPAALAWETTVDGTGSDGVSRLTVDVDAHTGAVLHTQEHVAHGNGTGAWDGPNPLHIDTTSSGGTFSLNTPNITNMPCQDAATNKTLTGTDDNWGNGDATSKETGCVDALFTAQTEFKMLSQWLGRNGMDGNGGAWPIRVGLDDENAYYDGTQVQVGHNTAGQWIGSMDVLGHEMGHGVDDHTPGSLSGKGTQEFVADVFGASTEWFANEPAPYDTPDFLVGDKVNLVGSGPIRNMANPSLIDNAANCYSSSIPNQEVHAAAGPGNHWFYLLSEGTNPSNGQPTSPTCNNTSITGIGVENAVKLFYAAMLMKTSNSSYLTYRTWTLQAAKNIDPTCAEFNTVKAAWDAVSVPAQSGDPTCSGGGQTNTVTVTNPGSQSGTVGTAASLQIKASDSASGQTLTYSATGLPAGLSINSSTGLISGTPTTAGTSNVSVSATDSTKASGATSFTWTVATSGGGGGCTAAQLVRNGGLESGTSPWTGTTGSIVTSANYGLAAHSGSHVSWLDGYGYAATDTLGQSVTIPAGCTSATLSFWRYIDTAESTTTAADTLKVQVLNSSGTVLATLHTYSNLDANSQWTNESLPLSQFAGQTVTLKFTGKETDAYGGSTDFVIDDVALNVS